MTFLFLVFDCSLFICFIHLFGAFVSMHLLMILSSVISVTHHYISEGTEVTEASACSIIIYITVLASVKSRCIFLL